MPKKILVVLTSHAKAEAHGKNTGWYLPEFAHFFYLVHPEYEIVVASPHGGPAPLSPDSVAAFASDPECTDFLANHASLWETTVPLSSCHDRIHEFSAVFYPGGHGPVFDLVADEHSIRLIAAFYAANKFVSAVCHGPIVLANVKVDGKHLIAGRRITGFTDEEERLAGWTDAMPVLLEKDAREKGALFEMAPNPWESHVVRDGYLITGQNPASTKDVAHELLKALS